MSEQDYHEALREAFGGVFAGKEVEGLDDDLLDYVSGLLAHQDPVESPADFAAVLQEVFVPFLDSVSCPDDLVQEALAAAAGVWQDQQGSQVKENAAARKLTQGLVNLSLEADDENARYLWGSTGVKAMANDIIDAHKDQSSAKEKRKVRKEAATQARKALSSRNDENVDSGNALVRMKYNTNITGTDKSRDVLIRSLTVSLDNGTVLLETGELRLAHPRRYGLIGENGVGKSTLLKAIAGDEIQGFPTHLRVLHVRQEVPAHLHADLTVMQAVLSADAERNDLMAKEKELLGQLEQPETSQTETLAEKRQRLAAGNASMQKQLKELDNVYARLQMLGSDNAPSRATQILSGLQFTREMQEATLNSLSGGWKMRVALAAALFVQPDILLLDEPTNHLDLEAVLWLEQYLQEYPHTLVVVSHDRGFLNSVCTDIMEFKRKRLTYYRGNFDTYVKLRDDNIKNAMRQYQAYQAKREHMMEFINTFRANAKRASMVQSRIKAVEKMDAEAPEPVEVDQVWRFNIPNSEPLGPPIIAVNDVYFDYRPERPDGSKKPESEFLLQEVNFGISLTSKIAILGANGQGECVFACARMNVLVCLYRLPVFEM
jgi:ATP-binding cassette, subfamily F, member 3